MCDGNCINHVPDIDKMHPEYPYTGKWTAVYYQDPLNIPGAVLEVLKAGQVEPSKGDQVLMAFKIYLPAGPADEFLMPGLRYGERCPLLGQPLTADWGEPAEWNKRRMRMKSAAASADTWVEASEGAHEMAHDELRKLKELLDARAEALKRAES
jgi:hypothetical protein